MIVVAVIALIGNKTIPQIKAADPGFSQNIQIWERRLKKEIAQVDASKHALRDEKQNLRLLQDRLAQRREQWKSHARRVRPDDVRGKQALKVLAVNNEYTLYLFSRYFQSYNEEVNSLPSLKFIYVFLRFLCYSEYVQCFE